MRRLAVTAGLALLVLPASAAGRITAHAPVRGLDQISDDTPPLALTDAAVIAGLEPTDRRLDVVRYPLAGGPRRRVYTLTVRRGRSVSLATLAGSARRVGLSLVVGDVDDDEGPLPFADVLIGPESGPFARVARRRPVAIVQLGESGQNGSAVPLGPPVESLEGVTARGDHVAWVAGNCILSADLSTPWDRSIPAGPCGRAVVDLEEGPQRRVRNRTARVQATCLASDTAVCRGTLTAFTEASGRVAGRSSFLVPVGKRRLVPVRLSRKGYRAFLRSEDPGGEGALLDVLAVTPDSAGRRHRERVSIVTWSKRPPL